VEHRSTRALCSASRRTSFAVGLVLAASLFTTGCGGPPKQANSEDEFGSKADTPSTPPASGGDSSASTPASGDSDAPASGGETGGGGRLTKDQQAEIDIALRRGRDKAAQCSDVVPNGPSGEASVKVTFDGKKGRSVDASVGSPFAGTPMEACIKRAFVDEIVVPFEGGTLDMSTTVKIAAKAAAPDPKKPKK
jgi:hypothetical protein